MDTPLFTPLITSYVPALLPRYETRTSYRHMHAFLKERALTFTCSNVAVSPWKNRKEYRENRKEEEKEESVSNFQSEFLEFDSFLLSLQVKIGNDRGVYAHQRLHFSQACIQVA